MSRYSRTSKKTPAKKKIREEKKRKTKMKIVYNLIRKTLEDTENRIENK